MCKQTSPNGIPWPEPAAAWKSLLGSWWSWSFSYMNPILRKGSHQKLVGGSYLLQEDLYLVPGSMESFFLLERFNKIYREEAETSKRLVKTLWRLAAPTFIPSGICELVSVLCQVVVPLLVRELLRKLEENPSQEITREGIPFALAIFVALVVNSFANHRHRHLAMKSGIVMRAAIFSVVYDRVLKLSPKGCHGLTSGEVNNIVAVDTQKLYEVAQEAHMFWAMPLSIILVTICLLVVLGPTTLVGTAVFFLFVPVVRFITANMTRIRRKRVKASDERIEIINGMLQRIKTTKLNHYEEKYEERINRVRCRETSTLQKELAVWALNLLCTVSSPVIATAMAFLTHVLVSEKNILTSADTFTVLFLFSALRFPVNYFGRLVGKAGQAVTSVRRISGFLNREILELDVDVTQGSTRATETVLVNNQLNSAAGEELLLEVENASFQVGSPQLGKELCFTASGFNFSIRRGKVLAVCGPVGSGKSTLIKGIIGEVEASTQSILSVRGTVSYVSQTAFILNATLRDNILFGLPYEKDYYEEVLNACCLGPDIKQLGERGDLTEIGERGVTLSGGQNQRVSLARAVYSRTDLVLLDDPLSALDAGTSKNVFERLINVPNKSLLRNSAVVLVTHASHFISSVDKVLVLVDGQVGFYGTWSQLGVFKPSNQKTRDAIEHIRSSVQEVGSTDDNDYMVAGVSPHDTEDVVASTDEKGTKKSIMTVEEREYGLSRLKTWKLWFRHAGGFSFTFTCIALLTLDRFAYVLVEYWLARWTEGAYKSIEVLGIEFPAQTMGRSAQGKYLLVYFILITISFGAVLMRSEFTVTGGVRCAKGVFTTMLSRVMRAPMSYFETTPMGRVLNRFTYDTEVIDVTLTENMSVMIIAASWYVAGVIIMCTILPWIGLAILVVTLLYWRQLLHYRRSGADLQRLDAIARSPVQAMVSEGFEGNSIIRTFRQEDMFSSKFHMLADKSSTALLNYVSAQRWLGVRIELLGAVVVLAACVLLVTMNGATKLEPGIAAMLIVWSTNFTIILNFLVDASAEAEAAITSIERVDDMSRLPQEKDWLTAESLNLPSTWPEHGSLDFHNVCMRYRKGLPLALDNLSFKISPGKRCGVVGRTGAGKSSLSTALFRLVEIESGTISLDGIDLGKLGLSDVRGRQNGMAIIPQDPFLTGTTLRECLDPFGLSSDQDILDAIKDIRLEQHSSDGIRGLDTLLEEGGTNLSVGERQLLNLARALLQKPRVLVLDEATASVDGETDAFIQQMLRTRFPGTTLITVAHRLNTIMDYDIILVMDAGKAVELGSPYQLLQQNGVFAELVNKTGVESAKALRAMVNMT